MPYYIITNISRFNKNAKEEPYETECGTVSGIQTNDAPVKLLLSLIAKESGGESAKIAAVVTAEAQETYQHFKNVIVSFAKQNSIPEPELIEVHADADRFASAVQQIISMIPAHANVYIDTTGGFRNSSYLLTAVVRILEYSGITLRKAVYSNYFSNPKKVLDVTNNYRLFNLINAANSFTSFGNASELAEFFQDKGTPEIRRVIDAMKAFSDAVALCRTSKLGLILNELNESLNAMQFAEEDEESAILFKSISGKIRSKFGIDDPDAEIGYPEIIRWCLDNQMIQQAVTIYTEKIPEYLFKNQYFQVSDDEYMRVEKSKKTYDEMHYALLYTGLMQIQPFFASASTPIARFLKQTDPRTFKDIAETENTAMLLKRRPLLEGQIDKQTKAGLRNIYRIKRALYDENGDRRSETEIQSNMEKNPDLADIMQRFKAKKAEGFLNDCKQLGQQEYELLQGDYQNDIVLYAEPHLNNITYLEDALKEHTEYSIADTGAMKQILADYYFIKNFLRNAFNHASDKQERTQEEKDYFAQQGYPTGTDLTLEDIIGIMDQALRNLKAEKGD